MELFGDGQDIKLFASSPIRRGDLLRFTGRYFVVDGEFYYHMARYVEPAALDQAGEFAGIALEDTAEGAEVKSIAKMTFVAPTKLNFDLDLDEPDAEAKGSWRDRPPLL